jgi:hypothetical protein
MASDMCVSAIGCIECSVRRAFGERPSHLWLSSLSWDDLRSLKRSMLCD